MLANISHSPAWRNQGFVCLACRRQKLRAQRQQRRWNSDLHQPSSAAASSDSWFDTLNDINDSFGNRPEEKTKADDKKSLGDRGKHEDAFANLKESLTTRVKSPKGNVVPIPKVSGAAGAAASQLDHSSHRRKSKRSKRGIHPLQDESQQIAQDVFANKSTRDAAKASANTVQLPDLIQQLQRERELKAEEDDARLALTEDGEDMLRTDEERADHTGELDFKDTQPRSSPSFGAVHSARTDDFKASSPTHDVMREPAVPRRRTAKQTEATVEESSNDSSSHMVRSLPAANALGGSVGQSKEEPQAHSLAARWLRQLKQQLPFGVSKTQPESATSTVSSDSLRNAELVSDRIASKETLAPFGISKSLSIADQSITGQSKPAPSMNDMSKLLASLQTHIQQVDTSSSGSETGQDITQTAKAVESSENKILEVEASSEQQVSENADVAAHDRLLTLYKTRKHTPKDDATAPHTPPASKKSPRQIAREKRKTRQESVKRSKKGQASKDTVTLPPNVSFMSIESAMKGGKPSATKPSHSKPSALPEASTVLPSKPDDTLQTASEDVRVLEPGRLDVQPLEIAQPHVPYLEHGLDRVLFNPGVYQLQDPKSRVYNFDPYLQEIMPVAEFDFDALKEYKTSSQDGALWKIAKQENRKYIGSTSSMTSSLAHFHYLLSNFREVNTEMLTSTFQKSLKTFTQINRAPSAIFLRQKNGIYAIDADKEYDGANVLMLLGKSMELLLTQPKNDYERYRKSDPRQVPEEQRTSPESYQYTTMRDFLMRSQLDAYDPRLPGNGTFDLKTRAVVTVRMQSKDFEPMTGYELFTLHGTWGSYEREYYDMMRSTMLKYMLQARMGRMDGIFVAYHNVKRLFGFQYIPMHELDRALHGQPDTCLGDQEFKASLDMMNEIFNKATAKFPGQSLRFHFETREAKNDMPTALHVFAEPMTEHAIDRIQNSQKAKIAAFERDIMGKEDGVEETGTENSQELIAKADDILVTDSSTESTSEGLPATEAAGSDTPTMHSTLSNADKPFLDEIAARQTHEELAPLFYATIICQNKVNGDYCSGDRPTKLTASDKWEIEYILKEYETTRYEWSLYNDCKARRREAFYDSSDDADVDAESDGHTKKAESYVQFLKTMSDASGKIRQKMDMMDAGKDAVRADMPLPRHRESIESLDDYMSWMYRTEDS